jgi:hypothetical protein
MSSFVALLRHALGTLTVLLLLSGLVAALTLSRSGVALRAYSWDDAWTGGAFVQSGATLYTHDPAFFLCHPGGCAPSGVSDRVGQAVGIVCRRDPEGYLKLFYATDREPAWVSAAAVRLKGLVPACGWWDW